MCTGYTGFIQRIEIRCYNINRGYAFVAAFDVLHQQLLCSFVFEGEEHLQRRKVIRGSAQRIEIRCYNINRGYASAAAVDVLHQQLLCSFVFAGEEHLQRRKGEKALNPISLNTYYQDRLNFNKLQCPNSLKNYIADVADAGKYILLHHSPNSFKENELPREVKDKI